MSFACALYGGEALSNVAWNLKARKLPDGPDVVIVAQRAAISMVAIGAIAKIAGASLQKSIRIGAVATAGIDALLFARLYQQA